MLIVRSVGGPDDTADRLERCVTRGSERAAGILRALGITELDPPAPPNGDQTMV